MSFPAHLLPLISSLVQAKAATNAFSGVVRLQQHQEILWEGSFGYANRAWNITNNRHTRFRIASIGKMFTAVALLQLVDQGQITLETRLLDHLPLPSSTIPPETTLFHLLTMTAGIADWFEETDDWEAQWAILRQNTPLYLLRQNRDYLPLFSQKPPSGPMGVHRYNNASYILLGLLLEQITGLTYTELIQQYVFTPAGMVDSGFWGLADPVPGIAEGYIPEWAENGQVRRWWRNIYETTPDAAADGGAISTATDLIRFLQMLRAGLFFPPTLTQAILTPHVLADPEQFRGYGWYYGFGNAFLLDAANQIVRYGHTGEEAGVSCRLYHYPSLELDVIILGNQSNCAGALGWAIHDILMGTQSV
ncbi:MAG: beta-lactamase family protein [Chloroflexi bacterium]|nr:beta-lactamase family protein [Chloroflexota bacterium]MBP8056064.1 beta-lactamase family protein [Chloroflexota bacterium]